MVVRRISITMCGETTMIRLTMIFCFLLWIPCANAAMTCAVPGAIDTDVTQNNITTTICKSGWTKTIRPPVAYTDALKKKLLGSKYSRSNMKSYELDHCIPLELGGNPRSTANLWLQPWNGKCGAHAKDKLENSLKRDVCAGRISLADARVKVMEWCP